MVLEDSSNSEIGIVHKGWINEPMDYSAQREELTCFICRKHAHNAHDCWKKTYKNQMELVNGLVLRGGK